MIFSKAQVCLSTCKNVCVVTRPSLNCSPYFLANDVTKVTSWLMSSSLENCAFRCTVSVPNLPGGGVFCEMLSGVCQRDTETLTLSAAARTHTLYMGVRPRGFELFCTGKSRSTEKRICYRNLLD